MDFTIVDYSEYSIAIFGDTRPLKDEIKAIGGKFNSALNKDGGKCAGWILNKKARLQLEELIGKIKSGESGASFAASSAASSASSAASSAASVDGAGGNGGAGEEGATATITPISSSSSSSSSGSSGSSLHVNIVDYSEGSLAIFGDTRSIKDELRAIGAKYNPYLTLSDNGKKKTPGWILPKNLQSKLELIINNVSSAKQEAGMKSPGSFSDTRVSGVMDRGLEERDSSLALLPADNTPIALLPADNTPSNKRKEAPQVASDQKGDFTIVDYSEYSIAIFGDTRPLKDEIKAIGGKFNSALNKDKDGGKCAGWILNKKARLQLEELIAKNSKPAEKLYIH